MRNGAKTRFIGVQEPDAAIGEFLTTLIWVLKIRQFIHYRPPLTFRGSWLRLTLLQRIPEQMNRQKSLEFLF